MTEPTTVPPAAPVRPALPSPLTPYTPLGVWGVTVAQVLALVPHQSLADTPPPGELPTAPTLEVVAEWVLMITADLSVRLVGWLRLADDYKLMVAGAGNSIVANGAASWLSAAGHGTGEGYNESSYSEVLWARYQSGVMVLGKQVDGWITTSGGPDDGPDELLPGGSAQGWFPPPSVLDGARW